MKSIIPIIGTVLISFLGLIIILFTFSSVLSEKQSILLAIGLGLLIGPVIGMVIGKSKYK